MCEGQEKKCTFCGFGFLGPDRRVTRSPCPHRGASKGQQACSPRPPAAREGWVRACGAGTPRAGRHQAGRTERRERRPAEGEPLEKETLRLKGGSNSAGTTLPPPPPSHLAAHPSNNTRTPAQSIYFHTCAFTTAGIPLALGYPSPAVLPGPWQWCLLLVGRGGRRGRRARVGGWRAGGGCAGHGAARAVLEGPHPIPILFPQIRRLCTHIILCYFVSCYCSCAIGEWGSAQWP